MIDLFILKFASNLSILSLNIFNTHIYVISYIFESLTIERYPSKQVYVGIVTVRCVLVFTPVLSPECIIVVWGVFECILIKFKKCSSWREVDIFTSLSQSATCGNNKELSLLEFVPECF